MMANQVVTPHGSGLTVRQSMLGLKLRQTRTEEFEQRRSQIFERDLANRGL